MQELQPLKLICSTDRHDHRAGQSKVLYYHTYLQSFVLFVEQTQKAKIWVRMWLPYKLSTVVRRARGARTDTTTIENNKTHTEHSKQKSNIWNLNPLVVSRMQ